MSVVGFDFGNESCIVAVARRRGIEVLQNEIGKRKTATMVAFNDKQRMIGDDATPQYSSNQKNTIINSKRLMGMRWGSPELEIENSFHPYATVEKDGKVFIEVMYDGKKEQFSPEQVNAAMFTKLKAIAEAGLESQVVDCVVSCPPYWTDSERRAMLDAANIAGLNVLRLMNETTAVALNYGILRPLENESIKVAFVDVGHAATNVSVVAFQKGKLQVLSTASAPHLGGRNFDNVLMQHFATHIQKTYKLDVLSNKKATFKLRKECTRIKTVLSANQKVFFNVEYIMNDTDVKGDITRDEFEQLSAPLLQQLKAPVEAALAQANTKAEDLAFVEVIGGATRIPMVQTALKDLFGKDLSKTCDSDESVARGCALQCAMLSPSFRVREFEVQDIAPYAVEMSWGLVGQAPEDATVLFPTGNAVPATKMISFKDRSAAFQLAAKYADPASLRPGISTDVGRWVVSGLPEGQDDPSKVKIKVRVKMNLHGVLSVRSAQLLEELPEEEPQQEEEKNEDMKPAEQEAAAGDGDAATGSEESKPTEEEATKEGEGGEEKEKAASAPMEDDKAEDTSASTEPKTTKPAEKKKKVRRVDLAVAADMQGGLSEAELSNSFEREAQMGNQDKVIAETNELRNTLESYCLEMRSKVRDGELKDYIEKAAAEKFCAELTDGEDWLYSDEGFDAQKSEYKKRVDALRKVGDPVQRRYQENERRGEYVGSFKQTLTHFQQLAQSTDAKYEHIEAEEREKVTARCTELDAWFVEVQGKQDRAAKHEDPVFTCTELEKKAAELSTFANGIMNKPKPAPPAKEEPKPEADAAAAADADAGAAGADAADAADKDAPAPMEDEESSAPADKAADEEDSAMKTEE